MSSTMTRAWRRAYLLLAAGALLIGLLLSSAPTAKADYGPGVQYQIEISANCNGQTNCVLAKGFGIWFWAELSPGGTGEYQAADCAHFGSAGGSGSFHDSGPEAWSVTGNTLTITGAAILGNSVPIVITVPATYGHSTMPFGDVIKVPAFGELGLGLPGTAQVQVAP
jgi:hypothetical protein